MPNAEVPLALAFGAGLVGAVNPCGFALLPSFISFYVGMRGRAAHRRAADGLAVGLSLTAGVMVVLAGVGVVFSLGAKAVLRAVPWATVIVGVVLVALGIWLLAGRQVALRLPSPRARTTDAGYRSIFAFGLAYGMGSLSCTLPVFLVVVGGALTASSALETLAAFVAYALGMGTVLMLLSVATSGFRGLLVRKLRRALPYVNRISGALLVAGGGYVVYYWLSVLSGGGETTAIRFVQRIQQRAQDLVIGVGDPIWLVIGLFMLAVATAYVLARGRRRQESAGHAEPAEQLVEHR